MIIDAILDRKDGETYGEDDRQYIREQAEVWGYDGLKTACAEGRPEAIAKELCRYIDDNGYDPELKEYVGSIEW